MILEAIYGYWMHRMNSEKFYNLSYEPKFSIFEGKSQKLELGWIPHF